MSGMMMGGPMGALAFGGATLGSSLLVDYMNQQQNLRIREQTAQANGSNRLLNLSTRQALSILCLSLRDLPSKAISPNRFRT